MESSDTQRDCNAAITRYLVEKSTTVRRLRELRERGWNNSDGDRHFARQRRTADESSTKTAKYFYRMMGKIGGELQKATRAFKISTSDSKRPSILDFCAAPGGFLATALEANSGAEARAFSLPPSCGGHDMLLPDSCHVTVEYLDITMLAADMGVTEFPDAHPDAQHFLPRVFQSEQCFDLVICDGQVLRTHSRASYREKREARRLTVTQLALGLEHVREGGKMIVLLHRADVWDTVFLLYQFRAFSSIRLLKPSVAHQTRSSFYLVASDIQSQHPEALKAVQGWKDIWRAATFASDEVYADVTSSHSSSVDRVLEEFGQDLMDLAEPIWRIQADALAGAPYIKAAIHGSRWTGTRRNGIDCRCRQL